MKDSDSNPVGFQPHHLSKDGYRRGVELFVPTRLKGILVEEEKRREEEEEAQVAAARAEARAMEINENPGKLPAPTGTDKAKNETDPENESLVWRQIDETDKTLRSRTRYPVFKSEQALALLKNLGRGDADDKARLDRIYKELVQRGSTLRDIARPRSLKPLEELAAKQPHMKEVVHFVMAQINLARRSQKPVRLQPMLLAGEAGVGKTHFVQALAKALSTTIHIQQLDSDITSSFLMGSDRKWGNSQHGMLFENVVLGQHANPVIVLDELDKSQRNLSYGSPLTSLYSVLEPLSARCVRDISLMFSFDASQVTWIATANNALLLDQPLRSRFREFHIMPPSASDCLALAAEVMRAAIQSVAVKGFRLDVSLRRHLAHLPARQISQLTLEGVANAVAANRRELHQQDFPRWLFDEDADVDSGVNTSYLH